MDSQIVNFIADTVRADDFNDQESFNIFKTVLQSLARDLEARGEVVDEHTFCI